jgi:hypothetical protein
MSTYRATTVRTHPGRLRERSAVQHPSESFRPRRGVAIGVAAVRRVPMLDWPAYMFSDIHPMADYDWIDDGLSPREGAHAGGSGPLHDHAGVVS